MKKSDIYEVSIKLLGIYVFLSSFDNLRDVLNTIYLISFAGTDLFFSISETWVIYLSILTFLFTFIFGLILTFKTQSIVKLVCGQSDFEESVNISVNRRVSYEIALIVSGILLLAWTLPYLLVQLKNMIPLSPEERRDNWLKSNWYIASAIKVLIGVCCVVFAKRIASWFAVNEE
ncbi:MAG: hypothetical protein GC181_13450 [Bacteroidetes bacterium]|nr:hypothetical protein [Bacteroidota bacterium]